MAAKSPFAVPPGAVAKVSIIDSTLRLAGLDADYLMKPRIEGFDKLSPLPTWSFMIESPTGKKVLFDLGAHRDLTRYIPRTQKFISEHGWKPDTTEHVADILRKHGMDPEEIDMVIWSHYHFDHIGDLTTFPSSVKLIVGPGFKDAVLPGYPTKEDSPVTEQDLTGREIHEIDFSTTDLKAGDFPAFDLFGDGSFYLLDTPGHCVGHLAGLARTTGQAGKDTFIMMGGDLCHHGGEIRPSPWLSIPDELPAGQDGKQALGAAFREMVAELGREENLPILEPASTSDQLLSDQTIVRTQVADADVNVWFVYAHDTSLLKEDIGFFPETVNDWHKKGWKEKTLWKFLEDFKGAKLLAQP